MLSWLPVQLSATFGCFSPFLFHFFSFTYFQSIFLKLWSELQKGKEKRRRGGRSRRKRRRKKQLAQPAKISTAVGPPMANSKVLKMGFIKGLSPRLITPNYHRVLLLKRMAAWQRTNTLSIHSFITTTEHLYLCYKSSAAHWSPLMHRLLISYEASWLQCFSSGKYYWEKRGPSFIRGDPPGTHARPYDQLPSGNHWEVINEWVSAWQLGSTCKWSIIRLVINCWTSVWICIRSESARDIEIM